MLVGSWLRCMSGLHSCLCFSFLEKLFLKAGSTPPRYLVICRASQAFSYRNLDTSSTPGGSIEKVSVSSIPSRYLVDRSSFCSCVFALSLDRSSTPSSVDVYFSRHLSRHLSIHRVSLACISFFLFCIFFLCVHSILFFFSCRSMVPCPPHSLYVSFLSVSYLVFWLFMPFDNRVKKGEKFKN